MDVGKQMIETIVLRHPQTCKKSLPPLAVAVFRVRCWSGPDWAFLPSIRRRRTPTRTMTGRSLGHLRYALKGTKEGVVGPEPRLSPGVPCLKGVLKQARSDQNRDWVLVGVAFAFKEGGRPSRTATGSWFGSPFAFTEKREARSDRDWVLVGVSLRL